MLKRWAGPLVATLILGGIALILLLNLETGPSPSLPAQPSPVAPTPTPTPPAAFREYPIGEEVRDDARRLRIAAVWLPSVQWDGQRIVAGTDVIHLEADVKATQGNPNGFFEGEFIPYLKIAYTIEPAAGGPATSGELMPMVAKDGFHYGATLSMPGPGKYRLTYRIQPPSAGGLGRHSDPVSGVAPWWGPFSATYDWDYEAPSSSGGR